MVGMWGNATTITITITITNGDTTIIIDLTLGERCAWGPCHC